MSVSLKDYIKSTLTQIIEATEEFNNDRDHDASKGQISKQFVSDKASAGAMKSGFIIDYDNKVTMLVDFDVATTVEENDKTSGGGSVKVMGIGGGIEGESTSRNNSESRIKFKIPLILTAKSILINLKKSSCLAL
jgi:hypothetical protein